MGRGDSLVSKQEGRGYVRTTIEMIDWNWNDGSKLKLITDLEMTDCCRYYCLKVKGWHLIKGIDWNYSEILQLKILWKFK